MKTRSARPGQDDREEQTDTRTGTEVTSQFFVTVRDEARGRHSFLLGPYDTHEEALAQVPRGITLAGEADPWSHFYEFGTAQTTAQPRAVFGR